MVVPVLSRFQLYLPGRSSRKIDVELRGEGKACRHERWIADLVDEKKFRVLLLDAEYLFDVQGIQTIIAHERAGTYQTDAGSVHGRMDFIVKIAGVKVSRIGGEQ